MYFNAHCHLELSALWRRVPRGLPFPEWLERLVAERRALTQEELEEKAAGGLAELRRSGTTALLDIVAVGAAEGLLRRERRMRSVFFHEILRFDESAASQAVADALRRQSLAGPLAPNIAVGLSPHAPYTTTSTLLRLAAQKACLHRQWLCVHAAETPEETDMFLHGRGGLREFLDPYLPADWKPPGIRPIEWLDTHDVLGPNTLLVHCNEVSDSDLRLIRLRGASVVVCPGSHLYFNRGAFPLARLLEAGIPTYLGTDSLASNDCLDMAREVALACDLAPEVPREDIRALAEASRAAPFLNSGWTKATRPQSPHQSAHSSQRHPETDPAPRDPEGPAAPE